MTGTPRNTSPLESDDFARQVESVVTSDPRVRELTRRAVDEVVTWGVLDGVRSALVRDDLDLDLANLDPLVINDALGESDTRLQDFLQQLKAAISDRTEATIADSSVVDPSD